MKPIDKYKLEYEMKSKGITIEQMCEHLNMSRSTFYRKCNGLSEFNLKEITEIVEYLGLESPVGIFFASKVS